MITIHKYFTSILDTISDGVFISDAAGTTLYVNRMYAQLSGMSETELRGKNVRELVDEGVFDRAPHRQTGDLHAEAQGRKKRRHLRRSGL